jgi:hypothetical protein
MEVTVAFVVFQLRFQLGFVGYFAIVIPPLLDIKTDRGLLSSTELMMEFRLEFDISNFESCTVSGFLLKLDIPPVIVHDLFDNI